jgi:carbonic anhydrase/acetyltransferase-like protein (isoleucine patch superfamily)
LVGIGANVLHKSKMGEGAILGSGAVLLGKEIPSRTLAVGVPASIKKVLPQEDKMEGAKTSGRYAENGRIFKEFFDETPDYSKL